jgi:hypothetical protein
MVHAAINKMRVTSTLLPTLRPRKEVSLPVSVPHLMRSVPLPPPPHFPLGSMVVCPLAHRDSGRHNHVTTFPTNSSAIIPTVTRTQVKTLLKQQTVHIQNNTLSNLDLRNTTLGYGFHFQHKNSRTFPVESFAHDMDAPCYVPNTVIRMDLQIPTVKEEIRRYSSQYSARLSEHPNDLVVNLMELPDNNRRLRRHLPNDVPTSFLV